jgi:hypothetical protein
LSKYTSPLVGFKLTLVMTGTDCIGSCTSNFHMIMITITTAPGLLVFNSTFNNMSFYIIEIIPKPVMSMTKFIT